MIFVRAGHSKVITCINQIAANFLEALVQVVLHAETADAQDNTAVADR